MPPPTPSTAPAQGAVGALSQWTQLGLKGYAKPILCFDGFSIPFWIRFGSLLGPLLAPKYTQDLSKMHFEALSSSKTRCSRNPIIKPMKFNYF